MISEKVNAVKAGLSNLQDSDSELIDLSYDSDSLVKTIVQQQKREFTKEEIHDIVSGYRNGKSTYALAKEFKCHRSTISRHLKSAGVDVKVEKIDIQDAIKMYEEGYTTKEIADKYHMTDNAVSRRLKKAGVTMRSKWDY